jgi:hypothetical protein
VDAAESLRLIGRGTEVRSRRRIASGLLVAEVALATTLLAGAALLVQTFVNLVQADRGLNPEGVIAGWVSLPKFSFEERATRLAFAAALDERLQQLPGVRQVSLSGGLPPSAGAVFFGKLRAEGSEAREYGEINVYDVSPRFFELFGIKLTSGRMFSEPAAIDEAIVGERLARMLWPDGRAVGRTLAFEFDKHPYRVIGIAGEIRNTILDPRVDPPELYFPLVVERNGQMEASAFESGQIFLALRCNAVCPPLPVIREAIRSVSAQVLIVSLGPMEENYLKNLVHPRAAAALASAFGAVALLASAGGLFSLLSAAVTRRRREFGIRVALGIDPGRLRALVFGDAARLAILGVSIGVFGAWMLGRGLASLTYGVSVADPRSWTAVCAALTCSLVAAAWRPASQAARIDPAALLREE